MAYRLGAMASSLAGPRILRCATVVLQGASIVMSPTVGRTLRTSSFTAAATVSWTIAVFALSGTARAEVASDRSTAARRILPLGAQITVCRVGCVMVRANDRGPFVRDTDLTPVAARAIGLNQTGSIGR